MPLLSTAVGSVGQNTAPHFLRLFIDWSVAHPILEQAGGSEPRRNSVSFVRRVSAQFGAVMGLSCMPGSSSSSAQNATAADVNEEREARKVNKQIEEQLNKDKQVFRATHRLLLLGQSHRSYRTNAKSSSRMICCCPSEDERITASRRIDAQLSAERRAEARTVRLLLLGFAHNFEVRI